MQLKKNIKPVGTFGPIDDLFNGYLGPEKFLKDKKDIEAVNNAISLIKKYLKTLEDANILEIC